MANGKFKMRQPKISFWLIGVITLVLLLRLPSLFEPYWYGDEGIYLVIGQMMNRGAVLYRDIWDNKPPLLYLLYAIQPTLLWAKISATIFVMGTCLGIYFLARKIFGSNKRVGIYALLTTALVGIFLSLPILEGTIANAELYFTLPTVLAAFLLFRETRWQRWPINFYIGILAAAAFLFKVPAIADFAGMILAVFIINLSPITPLNSRNIAKFILRWTKFVFPIAIAFAAPLVLAFGYFFLNHAVSDFVTASFLQNATYVAVDNGPFSKLTNPLIVRGVILLVSIIILAILFLWKRISKELLFLAFWFGFSLYGALLSNRPYMHYLLQVVPPTILLLIYLAANIRKYFSLLIVLFGVLYFVLRQFIGAFALEPVSYYQNFFDYASERKLWEEYVNYFDRRTLNSYAIADYLKHNTSPNDPIFVWSDASFIYVLSGRPAATKFIQAHHLSTIDQKNYSLTIERLIKFQPKYILISRPEHFLFPALDEFVQKNYRLVGRGLDMYVYQNNVLATAPLWSPNY